jgi:hypothetical protein
MKVVFGNYYFASEALEDVPNSLFEIYERNKIVLPQYFSFNMIKISKHFDNITFSFYPHLNSHAHPFISESITVNTKASLLKYIRYKTNPFILHRLENILLKSNLRNVTLEKLTKKEEEFGLYSKEHIQLIGRKDYWNSLCLKHNLIESLSPNE